MNDAPERRATLLADIEQVTDEVARLIVEATDLGLPIWMEVRAMPGELVRSHRDLRSIIPP